MSSESKVMVRRDPSGGFKAIHDDGGEITIDVPVSAGGKVGGWQPTTLLMAALGGCLAMDMMFILGKQGYEAGDYHVTVTGDRARTPGKPFSAMQATHAWTGAIPPDAVQRAIAIVDERYCTVGITLKHGIALHHALAPPTTASEG
jgi:putative redox protein